jgi:hypothetical protein
VTETNPASRCATNDGNEILIDLAASTNRWNLRAQ